MAEISDKTNAYKNEFEEVAFLSRKILDLNKQLIESEKAKTRFLSLVANELNNPMTALLGMIPRLAPPSGDAREGIFDLVQEEALVLDFRIQNLVAAAEIESGAFDLTYALVDVEELVREAMDTLKYPIKTKNIHVAVDNALEQKIVSDPAKLYLIIKNLLANACCYGAVEGDVNICIRRIDDNVVITVTNQGEGPKVEYKPQVFTRFARGPEGEHGLGLGLSIVRAMSERLNGNVDYDADGTVVTFTVTFPFSTNLSDAEACGSNEFLFESFDDAIEL